jgi:hypothetical protein
MYSTKERERVLAEFEASDLSAQAFWYLLHEVVRTSVTGPSKPKES